MNAAEKVLKAAVERKYPEARGHVTGLQEIAPNATRDPFGYGIPTSVITLDSHWNGSTSYVLEGDLLDVITAEFLLSLRESKIEVDTVYPL